MIAPEGYVPLGLLWEISELVFDIMAAERDAANYCSTTTLEDELSIWLCSLIENKLFVAPKLGAVYKIMDWPLVTRINRIRWFDPEWKPLVKVGQELRKKYNFCDELNRAERIQMCDTIEENGEQVSTKNAKPIMNERSGFLSPFLFIEFPSCRINFELYDHLMEGGHIFQETTKLFAEEFRGLNDFFVCVKEDTYEN